MEDATRQRWSMYKKITHLSINIIKGWGKTEEAPAKKIEEACTPIMWLV